MWRLPEHFTLQGFLLNLSVCHLFRASKSVHHIYFHLGQVSILFPAWVITLAPSLAALCSWITAFTFAEPPRNLEPPQQLKLQKRGEEKLSPSVVAALWHNWQCESLGNLVWEQTWGLTASSVSPGNTSCVCVSFAKPVVNQAVDQPRSPVLHCPLGSVVPGNPHCGSHPACSLFCVLLFKSGPAVFMNTFLAFPKKWSKILKYCKSYVN